MQHIAGIAERSWLDSWPGEMQKEVESQMDIVEAYKMMTGVHEGDEMEELNL